MTATTRTVPAHGTPGRYKHGCRNECCRAAERRRKKYRALTGPGIIDATPARLHIQALLDAGTSRHDIAVTAGCAHRTIREILNGQLTRIQARTAARILAVTPTAGGASVDATIATRQARALVAIAHPLTAITKASGLDDAVVSGIVNGRLKTIRAVTAAAIGRAYDALSAAPGTSVRSRRRAARHGWAPPAAWDAIDDPGAQPYGHLPVRRRSEDLAEDSDELLALKVPFDEVAARLGVSVTALKRARERTAERRRAAQTTSP